MIHFIFMCSCRKKYPWAERKYSKPNRILFSMLSDLMPTSFFCNLSVSVNGKLFVRNSSVLLYFYIYWISSSWSITKRKELWNFLHLEISRYTPIDTGSYVNVIWTFSFDKIQTKNVNNNKVLLCNLKVLWIVNWSRKNYFMHLWGRM